MSTFDYAAGVSNPSVDDFVQKAYPGQILNGIETPLGQWDDIREINGLLWFVTNAAFNAGSLGYTQQNVALASFAMTLGSSGITLYRAPIGAPNPIVWTIAFNISTSGALSSTSGFLSGPPTYTVAGAPVVSTFHDVWGQVTAIGSTVTVTFSSLAIFSATNSYSVFLYDNSTDTVVTSVGGLLAGGFTFNSTPGHVYTFNARGS